jgi:hypothetical protein
MIQAQNHQNWSNFHLKLQKESKIYMMGFFFRIFKILKMEGLLFLKYKIWEFCEKLNKSQTFATELPVGIS